MIDSNFKSTFDNHCDPKKSLLTTMIQNDYKFLSCWFTLMLKLYDVLFDKEKGKERLENSSVASLWMEILNTLEGVSILHCNTSISNTNILIRKLLEMEIQLKFILISDSENKAMAYEAYYVSRATQGSDNEKNTFLNYDKYKLYKEEADKAFAHKKVQGAFRYWFAIYDTVERKINNSRKSFEKLTSINSLAKEVIQSTSKNNEEIKKNIELFEQKYNYLSHDVHGFRARKIIRFNNKENYIDSFHNPSELKNQVCLCHFIMLNLLKYISQHYEIDYSDYGDYVDYIEKLFQCIQKSYDEWRKSE